jgi:alkaline phosphatase D
MASRPHLKYVWGADRGYVVVDVTPERMQADWWFVPTVLERTTSERFAKGMVSEARQPHLVAATEPAPAKASPDPAP